MISVEDFERKQTLREGREGVGARRVEMHGDDQRRADLLNHLDGVRRAQRADRADGDEKDIDAAESIEGFIG